MEDRMRVLEISHAELKNDVQHIKKNVENIPAIFEKLNVIAVHQSESHGMSKASSQMMSMIVPIVVGVAGALGSVFIFINQ